MKHGSCTECDKPLFDQNPDETRQLCDDCARIEDDIERENDGDLEDDNSGDE